MDLSNSSNKNLFDIVHSEHKYARNPIRQNDPNIQSVNLFDLRRSIDMNIPTISTDQTREYISNIVPTETPAEVNANLSEASLSPELENQSGSPSHGNAEWDIPYIPTDEIPNFIPNNISTDLVTSNDVSISQQTDEQNTLNDSSNRIDSPLHMNSSQNDESADSGSDESNVYEVETILGKRTYRKKVKK